MIKVKSLSLFIESQRFLLVSIVAASIDYTLYMLLLLFNINYMIAILFGYSVGHLFSFAAGRNLAFDYTSKHSLIKEFLYVSGIACVGLAVNLFATWGLSSKLGFEPQYSRILAMGLSLFVNFSMRRVFVYKYVGA